MDSRHSARRSKSSGWPRWLYWVVAAALFLPTIPMYRFILFRDHDGDAFIRASRHFEASSPVPAPFPVVQAATYSCLSGRLYRFDSRGGSAVLQGGQFVSCSDSPSFGPPLRFYPLLTKNQRCVGGMVVDVDRVNGVPTFTQRMDAGQPVRCSSY